MLSSRMWNLKFGSNMDKPKCWVKNVIKNLQFKVKVEFGLKI